MSKLDSETKKFKSDIITLIKRNGIDINDLSFRLSKKHDVLFVYYNGKVIRRTYMSPTERPTFVFYKDNSCFDNGTTINESEAELMKIKIERYKQEVLGGINDESYSI